jgi:hypothetical protein
LEWAADYSGANTFTKSERPSMLATRQLARDEAGIPLAV